MYVYFFLLINGVLGANILYISVIPSLSHHIWNKALAYGLHKKGHNITMLTHYEEKLNPENFHVIVLEGMSDKKLEAFNLDSLVESDPLVGIKLIYEFSKFVCENVLATNGLATLMKYPKDFKFDLIIIDLTGVQCIYPIIDRFNNPPVVGVTPFLLPPVYSRVFGNPLQPAYMPVYSTVFTDRMNFKQRLINFFLMYADIIYRQYLSLPDEQVLAKAYFGENAKSLIDIERHISILLANTDPHMEYPLDLPPNIIPVGGLHAQPAKPLPEDLEKFMNNAKNGVVVFSLGSFLRSDQMSESKRTTILNALAKLPQDVLWKFESDNSIDLPKNVIMRKWLPQSDLIAHPNTKLLINHGGALSTQEAMYHGVPVVSIPFFADQFANAGRLQNKNMSKIVDYKSMTTESFYETITEVLNNPMYRNNIQTLSKRYRDRLNTPLETAVFWVEYVLRHGSAEHLGLAARDMAFYEVANLDIYAVLLLGVYLIYCLISLMFTLLKAIVRLII